jgi:tetratricopeptide (TPR) repeat protein
LAGIAVALATFVLIRWHAAPPEAPRTLKPGERVWIDAVTRRPVTESFLMADKEFRMGEIFRIQNRFHDAQSFYRAAVSIDPAHVEAIDRLGYCLYKLESYEAAEAQFRKALAIEPGFFRSHFYLGRLHKRAQRWTEALAAYRQAFAARKDLTQIGIEYLDLLLRLGMFEEARPIAAELVQRLPTNREIAELQARLLREAP